MYVSSYSLNIHRSIVILIEQLVHKSYYWHFTHSETLVNIVATIIQISHLNLPYRINFLNGESSFLHTLSLYYTLSTFSQCNLICYIQPCSSNDSFNKNYVRQNG